MVDLGLDDKNTFELFRILMDLDIDPYMTEEGRLHFHVVFNAWSDERVKNEERMARNMKNIEVIRLLENLNSEGRDVWLTQEGVALYEELLNDAKQRVIEEQNRMKRFRDNRMGERNPVPEKLVLLTLH